MSGTERSAADKAVDEWQARIVAAAPRLTPEQAALISRLTRRNEQTAPIKADPGMTERTEQAPPGRVA